MAAETHRVLDTPHELEARSQFPQIPKTGYGSHDLAPYTHEFRSKQSYQDEVDVGSLIRLQRSLQYEFADKTVFTAVICPGVPEDQPLKRAVARVLLDTGSDVNIVSEKCLDEVGLSHLITIIPEEEQFEMSGIQEQRPWKFEKKFQSRFFLYSRKTTETAEFFVTKSSDCDILISQKQYAKLAAGLSLAKPGLLLMMKKKRSKSKLVANREIATQ
jgi:hypothetical protein